VHHVKVVLLGQPDAIGSSITVFMLAGTTGRRKRRGPKLDAGVALAAALHAALAGQQKDVVVVEDFHVISRRQKAVD
jgi:sugar (pentulose or hexulose) kinase